MKSLIDRIVVVTGPPTPICQGTQYYSS